MSKNGIITDQLSVAEYMAPPAGSKRLNQKWMGSRPNEIYVDGAEFIVVKENCRFEGIINFGGHLIGGYTKRLKVGDKITCTGWKVDFMTRNAMVPNWTMDGVPTNLEWLQFWPFQGLWTPWPLNGTVEPVKIDEASL